jgi:hypothetical protein
MNQIDIYLEIIQEGKVWDKVKKVWRDHKGKIYAGTSLAIAAKVGYDYNKEIKKNRDPSREDERREKKRREMQRQKDMLSQCPPGPDGVRRGKVIMGKFRCDS